jgi:outer membrane protein assembly factor BamB
MELLRKRPAISALVALMTAALLCGLSCQARLRLPRPAGRYEGWTMSGGEVGHRGFSAEQLHLPLTLHWTFRARGPIVASPILVGEWVCFGALDKRFYFLDAGDGQRLGIYKMDSGISSTAAAGPEAVYVATETGDENVYAFDLQDGRRRWKTHVGDVSCDLTYDRGRILISTTDGYIHCLSAGDGVQIWQMATQGQMSTAAAVTEEMAIFGCDAGYLYALSVGDGAEVWRKKVEGAVWAPPVAGGGMVYAGTFGGALYCLRAADGEFVWSRSIGGNITRSPALGQEMIYVGQDQGVFMALAVSDGQTQWQHHLSDARPGPPLVAGDLLLFGASDGRISALDAGNGQERWSYQTDRPIVSAPAVWNGRLLVSSMDGSIYVFGVPEGESSPPASIR